MSGWIKLHRKFLEWEWYDDHNTTRLFLHMLMKANHEEKKWRGIMIQPGQFVGSVSKLSEEAGISARSIRTCIDRLKSTGEVTSETTNKYTLFTLVNWGMYQEFDTSSDKQNDTQADKRPTSNRQTTDKQPTTNKNYKNEKNENNIPPLSPKGEQAKRKTQLSDDWQPDLEYAKQYGMNPELAFEIFSDWAKSKGHTYADWNLAWKKACREWLPDQCTKAVANQVRSGQPSQQSTGATCPKGRPYPPGCHYDKDQQLHRGPTGWEIDEERIMKMWQDLGNEENAKLWKPFDWSDFQDMEAAI
jgi:hypothetical protein